jgi:hypothetical protein
MATQALYFDASITGGVSTPANALGAPNGVFTTDANANISWTHRWGYQELVVSPGTPRLTGTQTISIVVRKGSNSGNPTVTSVVLFQAGTSIATISSGSTSVTSTTGQTLTYTFDASILGGNFANLELQVATTGAGGSPSQRNAVSIDASTWTANYDILLASQIKYWTGSAWVLKPVKRWTGTAWADAQVKRWNGSAWVAI